MDKRYLAGLIDGEGCIGLYRHRKSYCPRLQIEMCCKKPLEAIAIHYGVLLQHIVRITNNKRDVYKVSFSGDNLYKCLTDIYPYLIGKQDEARIVLQYFDRKRRNKGPISDEDRLYYEGLVTECKELKQR